MIQLKELQKTLMERLEQSPDLSDRQILELIDDMLLEKSHGWALTLEMRGAMRKELFDSVRRLDVIQDLIDDPKVTEIMVNGFDRIFVERGGIVSRYPKSFTSREKLEDVVQQIVGKCNRIINESSPIVDARLENGSRVNVVVEPACIGGPVLTIRRFPDSPITMERLIAMGSITQEAAGFLEELVKSGYSILIGGGTSAGKTTFLNALSHYIPGDERIITIEDTAELQIQGIENLVRLEARSANMAMEALEEKLGYRFNQRALLENALTHSSYANENKARGCQSNERLEFLGDSVLGMVTADYLFRTHPDLPEGDLTRTRAALVCEGSLVEVAQQLNLGSYLKLGKGEDAGGGRERPSIVADAVEAVIAAVYLDGGIGSARKIIQKFILDREEEKSASRDYKTALQELVQRESGQVLGYQLIGAEGPDHAKIFSVEVDLNGTPIGQGKGRSKKEAEQNAAKAAIEKLKG